MAGGKGGAGATKGAPNILGLTADKGSNFGEWFTQTIVKSEMIEYYDVSGCYILRPWSFEVWEAVQAFLDEDFKSRGVKNAYFPSFVTKSKLEAEANHVEGFAAEVAWVTKSGTSDLAEPIAIRPTSETIMYPAFAKWIRSHRDLPMLINQWCPVVRWEFKQPTPFIRTREFLWQEGHTAHATEAEAVEFARTMLEVYARAYQELLAVPVIQGRKSEMERFAGAACTFSIEGLITANGRGIQCATSHHLGQNFAKMFEIEFEDANREKQLVHQTSWGFTTRSIGTMVMVHGDNKGLVLPPRVAPVQVVIVPILHKKDDPAPLIHRAHEIGSILKKANIRVSVDDRDQYNPGWKYNHWELKGVPLRIEVGGRELIENTCRVVRRVDGTAIGVPFEGIGEVTAQMLKTIQSDMLSNAITARDEKIAKITSFEEVMPSLNSRKIILAPWCGKKECEEAVKKETQRLSVEAEDNSGMTGAMKTLCIPFDQPPMPEGSTCFWGDGPAVHYALWGRSY